MMSVEAAKLKIMLHTIAQKELRLMDNPIDRCDWEELSEEFQSLYTKEACPDCGPSLTGDTV